MGNIDQQTRIEKLRPVVENLQREIGALGKLQGLSHFMREAIYEACKAVLDGNYGAGTVAIDENNILSRGHDRRCERDNPYFFVSHSPVDALKNYHEIVAPDLRKPGSVTLVTTLEPCPHCVIAMIEAGVGKCIFGVTNPNGGQPVSAPDALPATWKAAQQFVGTQFHLAGPEIPWSLKVACTQIANMGYLYRAA